MDAIHDKCEVDGNVNDLANNIVECMTETTNKEAPNKLKRVPIKWQSKPWITKEVKEASKKRDWTYNAIGVKSDWEEYKKRRNEVITLIRRNKRNYYEQSIDKAKTNPKKMWNMIKELIGSK
ncbi:endonuclease-reverse transcriptase [Lasius niger]|uniref:Tpa: endonuclease-reverse transcriptase n=1 Tax=Lasius niger TaxID=67767 RepID=A0A0J7MWD8_LASNI|nr:endonuclease-reverse transcriptase [Lasius niger]